MLLAKNLEFSGQAKTGVAEQLGNWTAGRPARLFLICVSEKSIGCNAEDNLVEWNAVDDLPDHCADEGGNVGCKEWVCNRTLRDRLCLLRLQIERTFFPKTLCGLAVTGVANFLPEGLFQIIRRFVTKSNCVLDERLKDKFIRSVDHDAPLDDNFRPKGERKLDFRCAAVTFPLERKHQPAARPNRERGVPYSLGEFEFDPSESKPTQAEFIDILGLANRSPVRGFQHSHRRGICAG